jgi:hypothetical protein
MRLEKKNLLTSRQKLPQGVFFESKLAKEKSNFLDYLNNLELLKHTIFKEDNKGIQISLIPHSNTWFNLQDTTCFTKKSNLPNLDSSQTIIFEIISAMLSSQELMIFPCYQELISAINIRKNIVEAAQKTRLSFATTSAERPKDYWTYDENTGFTILPEVSLKTALEKATQPSLLEQPYSFSCWRATEYVFLLALAQELEICNPQLLRSLQSQWMSRAIKSDAFNNAFLSHLGSAENPLPARFYIPGDRVWFRNPDPLSADVTGYEGSFVFYLGNGLFSNFWKKDKPYTLTTKCVEIFHWRDAVVQDSDGDFQIDEAIVEECVEQTLSDPVKTKKVLSSMLRMRDPDDIFASGGCIDFQRTYVRNICQGTANISFPYLN